MLSLPSLFSIKVDHTLNLSWNPLLEFINITELTSQKITEALLCCELGNTKPSMFFFIFFNLLMSWAKIGEGTE